MVALKKASNRLNKVSYTKFIDDNTLNFPSLIKCPSCSCLLAKHDEEQNDAELLHCLKCDHYFRHDEKPQAEIALKGDQLRLDFIANKTKVDPKLFGLAAISQVSDLGKLILMNALVLCICIVTVTYAPKAFAKVVYPHRPNAAPIGLHVDYVSYNHHLIGSQGIATIIGELHNNSEKTIKSISLELNESDLSGLQAVRSTISDSIIFDQELPIKPGKSTKFKVVRESLTTKPSFFSLRVNSAN